MFDAIFQIIERQARNSWSRHLRFRGRRRNCNRLFRHFSLYQGWDAKANFARRSSIERQKRPHNVTRRVMLKEIPLRATAAPPRPSSDAVSGARTRARDLRAETWRCNRGRKNRAVWRACRSGFVYGRDRTAASSSNRRDGCNKFRWRTYLFLEEVSAGAPPGDAPVTPYSLERPPSAAISKPSALRPRFRSSRIAAARLGIRDWKRKSSSAFTSSGVSITCRRSSRAACLSSFAMSLSPFSARHSSSR